MNTTSHPSLVIKHIIPRALEGLNVVLIDFPIRVTAQPTTTPEGPLLLATNLRDNWGVNASVIALNGYRIRDKLALDKGLPNGRHLTEEETFALLKKHFEVHGIPDVVGFSGIITTLGWQECVAKMIRVLAPDTFLVSGNGLATELETGMFIYIPELDAVASGEGDEIIIKICFDAKNIKEIGWQNAINSGTLAPYYLGEDTTGRHRFFYKGARPHDLDALPYADLELIRSDVFGRNVLDVYLSTPVWGAGANNSSATSFQILGPSTTAVSSRGCPHACDYCFRKATGGRLWGTHSAEHIHQQITAYRDRYGIVFHGIPDDNMPIDPDRLNDLVPLLGPLGIPWGTHARMDEINDPRRFMPMQKAGCVYIGAGPESADTGVLTAIKKGGQTLKQGFEDVVVNGTTYTFPRAMTGAIRNCLDHGMHVNCTWIMALPTEGLQQLKNTVAFIRWQVEQYAAHGLPAESVNQRMFTLTWYSGTGMIRNQRVRDELARVFGISFRETGDRTVPYEPICDEHYHRYLFELDDATKVLHGASDEPLNFGDMPTDTFLQAREHVDSGKIFKILEM